MLFYTDYKLQEIRYPVILSSEEKEIASRVTQAFGQAVCGFDILRVQVSTASILLLQLLVGLVLVLVLQLELLLVLPQQRISCSMLIYMCDASVLNKAYLYRSCCSSTTCCTLLCSRTWQNTAIKLARAFGCALMRHIACFMVSLNATGAQLCM
jgi:hypothetical protein